MPQQRHINRLAAIALAGLIGLLGAATGVRAQTDYPNRPIKVVVPYTAGGNVDLTARAAEVRLRPDMQDRLRSSGNPRSL
jgi:tripartite-type tricarboxylate transporter receptor subunit TctC